MDRSCNETNKEIFKFLFKKIQYGNKKKKKGGFFYDSAFMVRPDQVDCMFNITLPLLFICKMVL